MSTSKTMRLSDDVVDFIESHDGKNFTEKFESMVRFFCSQKPFYEKQIANLKKDIEIYNKKLFDARGNLRGIEMINTSFENLKRDMNAASGCIDDFITRNKL